MARRVSAHRPARLLLLLRGLRPHRGLDVQPAREVAQGDAADSVAAADRVAQLPPHVSRLAAGPQRLLAPGPRVHRSRRQQEGRRDPGVPAAGREHPALRGRSLPSEPQLRQRHRGGQATGPAVPRPRRRHQALHGRHRHLGVGEQRSRRASRMWSWRAPATCPRWRPWRRSACSASRPPTSRCGSSTWSTSCGSSRPISIPMASPTATSTPSSRPTSPIIFAYHGYPWLIHRLTYRRTNHGNLHVHGYQEEGTTTTPFDMAVRTGSTAST